MSSPLHTITTEDFFGPALTTKCASNFTYIHTLIDGKVETGHSHGAGGEVISLVANEAALGTGTTDGEKKICANNGNEYTWDDGNSKWRVNKLNICTSTTKPSFTTYTIPEGTGILETDTNNSYTADATNSKWRVNSGNVYTSATRPTYAIYTIPEGVEIYETDTRNRYTSDATNSKWRPLDMNQYNTFATLPDSTTYTLVAGLRAVIITGTEVFSMYAWNGTNWYKAWSEEIIKAGSLAAGGVSYILKLHAGHLITLGPAITAAATSYLKEDGTWGTPVPATLGTAYQKLQVNSGATAPEWVLAPVAFVVKNAGAQSDFLANGTEVVVVLDTEVADNGSNFASNTFTAPITGLYQLSMLLDLINVDSASTSYIMNFRTSNKIYVFNYDSDVELSGDGGYSFHASILCDMDANDTVDVSIAQASGTAQTDIPSGLAIFTGHLVA